MDIGPPVHELGLVVVGTAVIHLLALPGHDPSVLCDSGLVAEAEGMTLSGFQEGVLPVEHELNRLFCQAAQVGASSCHQSCSFFLASEGAAQGLLNHADLVHGHSQHIRHIPSCKEGILGSGMHGHGSVVGVQVADACLRLNVRVLNVLGPVFPFQNNVSLFKCCVRISFSDMEHGFPENIVGIFFMDRKGALAQGFLNGIHARKLLILNMNRLQSLVCQLL